MADIAACENSTESESRTENNGDIHPENAGNIEEKTIRMGEKEIKKEEEQRPGIKLLRSWINKNIKASLKWKRIRSYKLTS